MYCTYLLLWEKQKKNGLEKNKKKQIIVYVSLSLYSNEVVETVQPSVTNDVIYVMSSFLTSRRRRTWGKPKSL